MPKLNADQPAPDFSLASVAGEQVSLDDLKRSDQNTLLIFLRHLG